jgi:hypothetical protein
MLTATSTAKVSPEVSKEPVAAPTTPAINKLPLKNARFNFCLAPNRFLLFSEKLRGGISSEDSSALSVLPPKCMVLPDGASRCRSGSRAGVPVHAADSAMPSATASSPRPTVKENGTRHQGKAHLLDKVDGFSRGAGHGAVQGGLVHDGLQERMTGARARPKCSTPGASQAPESSMGESGPLSGKEA